jgi:topoisomerase-4 subunit A
MAKKKNNKDNKKDSKSKIDSIRKKLEDQEFDSYEFEEVAGESDLGNVIPLSGMYREWFLDYASYVILERAVPALMDGLKPVQRRILHSMKEMEDGRYNKVANVIGHTMKYHPHGDASIGDALVQLGQKDLLIDTQGNWGNILTGDSAAAARYIEARLSKFALDVVFNPKTTSWQASYDGRNKEPLHLPVKFPLLLAQGGEGIAVGLACKILPHNFNELIDGSIDILRGKKPHILPDFATGGMADFSQYNDGLRGGRVRVRARIRQEDKRTLVVEEIPFGTTTSSLIESVVKATEKGKIKIKKIEDNTSENVEIVIHLHPDVSPDKTIDALYAFTDCEVSVAPNACVIENDRPRFVGVTEMLKLATQNTVDLLKLELEIKLKELNEQWHFASLEKIFIEKKVYRRIEDEETWEGVVSTIHKGLKPFTGHLLRDVTDEDVVRLTEIKIKRISKFDSNKADDHIKALNGEIKEVKHHLKNLIEYAIEYYKNLRKKYSEGKDRKTEIKIFDTIEAAKVIVANKRMYINRVEGFIGTSLRNDEFLCECSPMDDIIVFREDGKMMVVRASDKKFVGKGIIYANIWRKGDERMVYHYIYQEAKGPAMMKRFNVKGLIRDKEYEIGKGDKSVKVIYFTANPNGEAETISVLLKPKPELRKPKFDFDLSQLAIKGMNAAGNILTKHTVQKIIQKEQGGSTLAAIQIWFDDVISRLNTDGRGELLGSFSKDDKILVIYQSGHYRLYPFAVETRFEEDIVLIEKFDRRKIISAVYFDGEKEAYFAKRFHIETVTDKKVAFIPEDGMAILELATTQWIPRLTLQYDKKSAKEAGKTEEKFNLGNHELLKNEKGVGKKLTSHKIKQIDLMPPKDSDVPENLPELDDEVNMDDVEDLHHTFLRLSGIDNKPKKGGVDEGEQTTLF